MLLMLVETTRPAARSISPSDAFAGRQFGPTPGCTRRSDSCFCVVEERLVEARIRVPVGDRIARSAG